MLRLAPVSWHRVLLRRRPAPGCGPLSDWRPSPGTGSSSDADRLPDRGPLSGSDPLPGTESESDAGPLSGSGPFPGSDPLPGTESDSGVGPRCAVRSVADDVRGSDGVSGPGGRSDVGVRTKDAGSGATPWFESSAPSIGAVTIVTPPGVCGA